MRRLFASFTERSHLIEPRIELAYLVRRSAIAAASPSPSFSRRFIASQRLMTSASPAHETPTPPPALILFRLLSPLFDEASLAQGLAAAEALF